MHLIVALLIVGLAWNCVAGERQMRELRRLSREPVTPQPDSPSPHQLLGEIARPLATPRRRKRSATS
ncbi:MAG TPA: hypothetical protein VFH71_04090 [Rhodanobacteraceae bacterium]|nr:hypothetical protein [Rhodanobacteraceae bacterium]